MKFTGGVLNSLVTIIRSIIGVRQNDDDYDSVEGSGDETEGSGVSFGVEIEPGSFLDMVFNIIPGRIRPDQTEVNNSEDADDDYYSYDYDHDNPIICIFFQDFR